MQLSVRVAILFKCLFIGFVLFGCVQDLQAQSNKAAKQEATYRNPVISGDFADPSVIRVGDTYYATGTSSEWAPHYPLFQSKDLVNWEPMGYVFPTTPAWMQSSFWAPELFYQNNTFYVYYTVKRKSDGKSCIGVASTKDLSKGFTDHGIVVEHGSESIDAYVWNENGQLYISWKAYGLDKRPIEILASKLSSDGLTLQGQPFTLLKESPDEKGIEGQCLVKKNGYYYLFYSAGACCGSGCTYNVRVARAKSINEPFVRYEKNPLLDKDDQWKCPGHGTLVETPDKRTFYLYHAYNSHDHVYTGRQAMLDELLWDEATGWPYFKYAQSPSIQTPMPVVNSSQQKSCEFIDSFEATSLSSFWQWNFRSYTPVTNIEKGNLYLSGKVASGNKTGIALTVRPAKGNYEIITEVVNQNNALKGLVLYGDSSQAVGIGVKGNTVEVWEVKNNQRKLIKEETVMQAPIQLKLLVENGFMCRFYWRTGGKDWTEIKPAGEHSFYDGSFLPQWDRSARAGLFQYGEESQPGVFSSFSLTYH
ncbi:glycoside hydrolase family 43 protein [Rhodocytophaga aerolata]|uniref:Glycoside hydrolase family 43 protein n=1 Tax=Rhodocytophaga aerolata TaxID=455078 RepID=A0ABT8RBI4_9BACT|nr:glycoside hydrolase family 43 protein [Rhodocytophaga aerolata]MDO1449459.1 glycoside hydrolase family 43 protein [Rhodocytophaga aerolata]